MTLLFNFIIYNIYFFHFRLKAELDEHDHFMVFHRYDDPMTFKLIGAVCEVLGVYQTMYRAVFMFYMYLY